MNNNSKTILALLAGLAAGAVLGVLFAPDNGTDTREKLADSFKDISDSVKDTAGRELQNILEFKDKLVDNIKTKINGAEEEYQDDLEHA